MHANNRCVSGYFRVREYPLYLTLTLGELNPPTVYALRIK